MLALLLAALLAANPLPDDTSPIDSLQYNFGNFAGPSGHLSVTAAGKVKYSYISAPHTGSGGTVVQKDWELTKDEVNQLFAKLVADGLFDADAGGAAFFDGIRVSSGRWWAGLDAKKVPPKAMAHLRALMAKAHPDLWGEKPKPKDPPPVRATAGVLSELTYNFAAQKDGDRVLLYVTRAGAVLYTRQAPQGRIQKEWTLPKKDAEALLDAVTASGVFDLETVKGGPFPMHMFDVGSGRWRTSFYPKESPDAALKVLRPLLEQADADFWKKP